MRGPLIMIASLLAGSATILLPSVIAAEAAAPGATVTSNFACNGTMYTGTISGTGLPLGIPLNSAVVNDGAVDASDDSGRTATLDGEYHSATMSYYGPPGGGRSYIVRISRADTGQILATAAAAPPTCNPKVTATARRDCATGSVSGEVTAVYLRESSTWVLMYNGPPNAATLGSGRAQRQGVPMTISFTTDAVPRSIAVMSMRLLEAFTSAPSIPVTASLNPCTTSAPTSANERTRSDAAPATAKPHAGQPGGTHAAANAGAESTVGPVSIAGPSDEPASTGTALTAHPAAETHRTRTHPTLLVTGTLGSGVCQIVCVCMAG